MKNEEGGREEGGGRREEGGILLCGLCVFVVKNQAAIIP